MRQRLQRASRAPDLLRQASPRPHACSASPELRYLCASSTSLRVQHASRVDDTSTSPRPHACGAFPELLRQTPRCYKCSTPPESIIHLHLYVYTAAACLQSFHTSMSLRLQRISKAPNLCASSTSLRVQHASRVDDTSTSPRPHACSASPELLRQTPPRPYTCSTLPELPISRSPYLF